jgi:hypothetical protein
MNCMNFCILTTKLTSIENSKTHLNAFKMNQVNQPAIIVVEDSQQHVLHLVGWH